MSAKKNTLNDLAGKGCASCESATTKLEGANLKMLLESLGNQWAIVKSHHLEKEFKFKNFRDALDFVNKIGDLAEEQGHHPDIYLAWGRVKVTIWTHKVDGLTDNDFALAALIERLGS